MKKSLVSLALAAALVPAGVSAQGVPPDPPMPPGAGAPGPSAQQFAAMRALHDQIRQLHAQARTRMLAALTPEHRTALANIIGQLAIAPNPDPPAAAAHIDALLSGSEKQAVLDVETSTRASMRSLMESAHAQMGRPGASSRPMHKWQPPAPDAGRALLHLGMMARGPKAWSGGPPHSGT